MEKFKVYFKIFEGIEPVELEIHKTVKIEGFESLNFVLANYVNPFRKVFKSKWVVYHLETGAKVSEEFTSKTAAITNAVTNLQYFGLEKTCKAIETIKTQFNIKP